MPHCLLRCWTANKSVPLSGTEDDSPALQRWVAIFSDVVSAPVTARISSCRPRETRFLSTWQPRPEGRGYHLPPRSEARCCKVQQAGFPKSNHLLANKSLIAAGIESASRANHIANHLSKLVHKVSLREDGVTDGRSLWAVELGPRPTPRSHRPAPSLSRRSFAGRPVPLGSA